MSNPYSAPAADMSSAMQDGETYQPKLFAMSGRIGRIRYLAYSFIMTVIMYIVIGALSAVLIPTMGPTGFFVAMFVVVIPALVMGVVIAKRRLNDLDKSGWLAVLMIIPIINFFLGLYMMFAPGSAGVNQYGPKPTKNSVLLVVGGILVPLVFVGGLAAVAIPAYQQYLTRAKQAEAAAQEAAQYDEQADSQETQYGQDDAAQYESQDGSEEASSDVTQDDASYESQEYSQEESSEPQEEAPAETP